MVTPRRAVLPAALAAAALLLMLAAAPAGAKVVWLCKPGMKGDACKVSLTTTKVDASGRTLGVDRIRAARKPKHDCFYVYPTVSDQDGVQATRVVDDVLRSIALYQAARYTRDCRVFAPVYRQITLKGLLTPDRVTPRMRAQGLADVKEAWREYLRRHNRGRGVVLIGHSQGTYVLKELMSDLMDGRARSRRRLISALLLGGTVEVEQGSDRGGTFENVPACRSARQTGCVIAFSAFGEVPPEGSLFSRASAPGREVLCTNPAALRTGGPARMTAVYPTRPFADGTIGAVTALVGNELPKARTPWVEAVGANTGTCIDANGAQALLVSPVGSSPALKPSPDPTWGLHLVDANIALGQLTDVVRRQAEVWRRKQG